MDQKKLPLLIGLLTICINLIFAYTGVTDTVSCKLAEVGHGLVAGAAAAELPDSQP